MQVDMQALGAADAAPDAFVDPISKEVMRDPVSTVDGQTYEREHIAEWLKNHDTSPLTNARLGDKTLTPNIALRKAIDEWAAAHFKTIPRSQLKIGRQIARSSFKTVWQGEVILGAAKKEVAVLEVRDGDIAAEVKTLIRLGRHPHLVRYIGVCHDVSEGKQYILVEYAPLGSLAVAMEQIEDGIKPGHQLSMLLQICAGMEALAAEGMVHRDLALRNVLLFNFDSMDAGKVTVKVSDFGLALSVYAGTHKTVAGGPKPVRYMAPESLSKGRYSEKSDVWAFGVTAWELLTCGDVPYLTVADDDRVIVHVLGGGRLERPSPCRDQSYDALWSVVQSCFAHRPQDRPTFAELGASLGQLSQPQGRRVVLPPPTSPGMVVSAASVAKEDLYVLRSTKQLVTMAWLFENGYTKSDCDKVEDVAQAATESLALATQTAETTIGTLATAVGKVKQAMLTLVQNKKDAAQAISTSLEAVASLVDAALKDRRVALEATLAEYFQERETALMLQLSALQGMLLKYETVLRVGQDAIGGESTAVVESNYQVLKLLENSQASMATVEIEPSCDPTIPHEFKMDVVEQLAAELRSFGGVGVVAPIFEGYEVEVATYMNGEVIPENTPIVIAEGSSRLVFSVAPSLPSGLTINAGTGVISGTPAVEAAIDTLLCTVTVKNAGGSASCDIRVSVAVTWFDRWDTALSHPDLAFSDDNTTVTGVDEYYWAVGSDVPLEGTHYFDVEVRAVSRTECAFVGFTDKSQNFTTCRQAMPKGVVLFKSYNGANSRLVNNGTYLGGRSRQSKPGDVIRAVLNRTAQTVTFLINGEVVGTVEGITGLRAPAVMTYYPTTTLHLAQSGTM